MHITSANNNIGDALFTVVLQPSGEITQWDLELLYGRAVQWAFLESKARKCLRDQDAQATVCKDQILLTDGVLTSEG